jgi:hypothetical protein
LTLLLVILPLRAAFFFLPEPIAFLALLSLIPLRRSLAFYVFLRLVHKKLRSAAKVSNSKELRRLWVLVRRRRQLLEVRLPKEESRVDLEL